MMVTGRLRLHESRVVSIARRVRQVQRQGLQGRHYGRSSARRAEVVGQLVKFPKRQHGSVVSGRS